MGNSPVGTNVREEGTEGTSGNGAEGSPQSMERTVLEQALMKDCSLWTICAGAGEQHEKEGVPGRSCYGLITTSIPHPAVPLQGGRGKGLGNGEFKLRLGRR